MNWMKKAQSGGRWGSMGSGMLYVCPADGTAMLLLRSPDVLEPDTWGIPGGAVKGTEDAYYGFEVDDSWVGEEELRESAEREAEEELGLLPRPERELGQVLYEEDGFKYVTFVVAVSEKEKRRIVDDAALNWENSDLQWFPADKLPGNLHFGVDYVRRKHDYFRKNASLVEEIAYLKRYLAGGVDPYDYSHLLPDFLEGRPEMLPPGKTLEDYEDEPELWIDDASEEQLQTFKEYAEDHPLSPDMPYEAPPYETMFGPELVGPTWLVHFTDSPAELGAEGFAYGHEDFMGLALTTWKRNRQSRPGYNFAFLADSGYARRAARGHRYGQHAVVFWGAGIRVFHSGDSEEQIIVWGPSIKKNMVFPVYCDGHYDQWYVENDYDRELYRGDFDKVVTWVENNYRMLQAAREKIDRQRRERQMQRERQKATASVRTASVTSFEELREWRRDDGGRHYLFVNEGEDYKNHLVNRIPYYGDESASPSVFYGIVKDETGEPGKKVSGRVPPTPARLRDLLDPQETEEEFSVDQATVARPPEQLSLGLDVQTPHHTVWERNASTSIWTQDQVYCEDDSCYDVDKLKKLTEHNDDRGMKVAGLKSALFENAWGDRERELTPMMVLENPTGSKENVEHMARIRTADLSKPLLVRHDGQLVDGYHRLARAVLEGRDYVQAVCIQKEQMEKARITGDANRRTAGGRIPICSLCGKQFRIGNLDSYQDLGPHARRRGWVEVDGNWLCPECEQQRRKK